MICEAVQHPLKVSGALLAADLSIPRFESAEAIGITSELAISTVDRLAWPGTNLGFEYPVGREVILDITLQGPWVF